jgi:hypothetical protein
MFEQQLRRGVAGHRLIQQCRKPVADCLDANAFVGHCGRYHRIERHPLIGRQRRDIHRVDAIGEQLCGRRQAGGQLPDGIRADGDGDGQEFHETGGTGRGCQPFADVYAHQFASLRTPCEDGDHGPFTAPHRGCESLDESVTGKNSRKSGSHLCLGGGGAFCAERLRRACSDERLARGTRRQPDVCPAVEIAAIGLPAPRLPPRHGL